MVTLRTENSISYSLPYLNIIADLQLREAGFRSNVFAFFPHIVRFVRSFNNPLPLHCFCSVESGRNGRTEVLPARIRRRP